LKSPKGLLCFCGQTATQWHHPTATFPGRAFLDAEFVVPVCDECHDLIHEDYRFCGIVLPLRDQSIVAVREHRHRCMGLTLLRIADVMPTVSWIHPFATQLLKMADDDRDEMTKPIGYHPDWSDQTQQGDTE
jgi:hypothetical protein